VFQTHHTMRTPLRIAILECDTPLRKTHSQYNGYREIFQELLHNSLRILNHPDQLIPENALYISGWDVYRRQEYPKLEDIDAVFLTGSKFSPYDDEPWINRLLEFLHEVLAQDRVRILAACFGHQIVGRALGAKVGRHDKGWEIAVCEIDLTDKGKEVFKLQKIRVQESHRDAVLSCPPGVTVLGSSPHCEVQVLYAPRRLLTVQGHPEYNKEALVEIISHHARKGTFSEDQAQEAISRAGKEHDGVAIGAAFLRFLLDD
ncbi:Glutamine amidotransferase type 1, partial [Penicillium frequentans]